MYSIKFYGFFTSFQNFKALTSKRNLLKVEWVLCKCTVGTPSKPSMGPCRADTLKLQYKGGRNI